MADTQTGPIIVNFIDKRRGRDYGSQAQAEFANYSTVTTLRTRLAALAAGTYTTAVLNTMTVNDMEYALRMLSADSAGI